jgi:antitoxin PrlF
VITSKITKKAQTTIPRGVREALEVGAGDRLAYELHPGYAIIRPYEDGSDGDPALGPFLALLAADIRGAPENLRPVTPALVARIREIVGDADFDPDAPIDGEVAL